MIIFFLLSKNILFVGDSHTEGYFGQNLKKNLTQSNNTVKVLAKAGSGVAYWTINEQFVDQVKSTDEVIIALGTNDFASYQNCNKKTSCIKNKIQEMINLIPPGKKCTWIGPPEYQKGSFKEIPYSDVQYVIQALNDTLINSKCTFIDSSSCPMTRTNKNDVHFNLEQSKVWSDCIAKQMKLIPTTINTSTKPIAKTKTEDINSTPSKPIAAKPTASTSSEVKKNIPNVIAHFPTANDNCKITILENKCAFFRSSFSQTKIAYLNNIRGALLQGKKLPAVCVDFFKYQVPLEGNNCADIKVATEARSLEIMESARQAGDFLDLVPDDKDQNFIASFYQQLSFYGIAEGDKNPEKIFSTIKNSALTLLEVKKRCPKLGIKISQEVPYAFKNFNKKILYFKKTNDQYSSATIVKVGSQNTLYSQSFDYYFESLK